MQSWWSCVWAFCVTHQRAGMSAEIWMELIKTIKLRKSLVAGSGQEPNGL